jgi:uncharacterized ferritin-like protein (DUF455 family)
MCAVFPLDKMQNPLLKTIHTQNFTVITTICLKDAAIIVLSTPELQSKVDLTQFFSAAWKSKQIHIVDDYQTGEVPEKPIRSTTKVELQKKNSICTMLHGIAHAEGYAIELFWDCVGRFTHENLPISFYNEMVDIAQQEATHFLSWRNRLDELDCPYGSLWSHEGLWKSAQDTSHRYALSMRRSVIRDTASVEFFLSSL